MNQPEKSRRGRVTINATPSPLSEWSGGPGRTVVKVSKDEGIETASPSLRQTGRGTGVWTYQPRNPKGISPQSPGLRHAAPERSEGGGMSYPGRPSTQVTTPTGLRLNPKPIVHPHSTWCLRRSVRSQPLWGCAVVRALTQGSSCLATLGFGMESRWDSRPNP